MKRCVIKMIWSEESRTWYTDSDDVPGLALGSDTFENLVDRVRLAAPEMLELNLGYIGPVELVFESVRSEILENAS